MPVEKYFRANENQKKRSYGNRVFQIKNESFTPLVFAANGSMEKECFQFYKRSAEMIADKRKAPISSATNNIRTLVCFSLLRSTIRCLRGSRNPRYSCTKTNGMKVNAMIKIDSMKIYDISWNFDYG